MRGPMRVAGSGRRRRLPQAVEQLVMNAVEPAVGHDHHDVTVLMLRGDFGYGGGLQDKTLPFFKAYYGGGVGSVRGYETASLGPQDLAGNTIGGREKVITNAELFFPLPGAKSNDQSVRLSVFADAGLIRDAGLQPELESFWYSVGVGVAWNSPVGPLKLSYGLPLKKRPGTGCI